jgi:hypothetical protein
LKWIETNNKIVAYFDVMGFKDLVFNNPHEDITKKMRKFVQMVNSLGTAIMLNQDGEKTEIQKVVIFSDSIMLISIDDSLSNAIDMMMTSSLILGLSLNLGLPINGCIAFGEFTADFKNSLFLGKPLIDAYLLQKELLVYSIVLHHSFEKRYGNEVINRQKMFEGKRWFKYLTPFKSGKSMHYHLNWILEQRLLWKNQNDTEEEKNQLNRILNEIENVYLTISGADRVYIDNTLDITKALIKYSKGEIKKT